MSIKDAPNKNCTAIFPTTPNTTRTLASSIVMWTKTVPRMLMFWLVALCNDGAPTARMFWGQSVSKKCSLIKFCPAPVSNMHYTGCLSCDNKPKVICVLYFLLKRQVMPWFLNVQILKYGSGMFFLLSLFILLSAFRVFLLLMVFVPYHLRLLVEFARPHF